ncbi:MAG: alpha-2-macroglobulin family protein [Rhizobiaceae bacterium]
MRSRAAHGFFLFFASLFLALTGPALAAENARTIVTTQNSDYFGFDLRSEQNFSLDQCKSTCLADRSCRAFTYNSKARWCFLKSDYRTLNPFSGAVAGKVVDLTGEPDIGAPAKLDFLPNWLPDEAINYRQQVTTATPTASDGLNALVTEADAVMPTDPRAAMQKYADALTISPDDSTLWTSLARAALAIKPANSTDEDNLKRAASSAAYNAYLTSRTTNDRAVALAALAPALEKREAFRPAIQTYEASLALQPDAAVKAAYLDLKARKGFRIVGNTVDSDNQTPRVCAQFSDPLVKSGVDYMPFVRVDGQAPKAITANEKQICVEGLEHGKRYQVTFRPGLPAAIGETLQAPIALSVYVRDRTPFIRFTGENFILPGTARHGIPLVSVNTSSADLRLYRINDRSLADLVTGYQFLDQLSRYSAEDIADRTGSAVWQGKIDIASDLNKEVVTSFPVDEALPSRKPGIYILTATPAGAQESYDAQATQWFVVSDIGLSTFAGQDGLNVFARSLGTAKPLADVELKLLAKNNEVLGTAKTDADGHAVFSAGLSRGEGGMTPAVLSASKGGDDFVFLDMTKAGFDLSDRGVAGRASPGALDVYAWTERGIYRAGETVHAAALARDDAAKAVENLPLTFIFSRPDGVEDRRIVSDAASLGGRSVDLALSPAAMRGTWTMRVYTDPKKEPVAEKMFLVEHFVPDRIEFDMTAKETTLVPGEKLPVDVDGRFLYGAPGAGLSLAGEVNVTTKRDWKAFPGYQFGLAEEENTEATAYDLNDLPVTDEEGKSSFDISLDNLPSTTRLLNAELVVRMTEGSGRAVERRLDLDVQPDGPRIGIRPANSDGSVPENSVAKFSVIAGDPAGKKIDMQGLNWSLVKLVRNYQWYRDGSSWRYEPIDITQKVADGHVDVSASGEASISAPVGWGRYRIEIESPKADEPASSVEFDAGWYVAASSTETPDALEIALDKESYAVGDTAHLKISPRFAGEVLVTVGGDRLLATKTASVPADGATVDIPVESDWGAGAYVTATLYRPGEAQASRMPMRAIGIKWLKVDPGKRKLDVSLETPAKVEPRGPLTIPVKLGGLTPGEEAYVTVAAVDVGILNLTRYTPPDPDGWYYGQRQLGLEIRDIYGKLIDGSAGVMGRIRTGGDGAQMASEGSPPTQKLVAFFTGPVKVDNDGRAAVSFDLPQFNGTVRVMATAWSKTAVGHASSDVIVRDPVVITAGLPRFMAPGDQAQMRLDIANTDGPAGEYTLAIDSGGKASAGQASAQKISLAAGARSTVTVPLTATATGEADIHVRLSHADGLSVEQDLAFPVRPAQLPVTTRRVVSLAANGGSLRIDKELLAASLLDGASVSIGVSNSAALDIPSLLMALDRYPYGCAEQTTSRALPLLYVSQLSKASGMPVDPDLHKRIQDAIYRVLNDQSSSGSFGLWGPGSGDLWLDAYISDFLTRAREQDFDVPDVAMRQALDNLQNTLSYSNDMKEHSTEIAYALYVLARNHRASVGDLRYYADTQLDAFQSPMARAQIAASLALYGDSQRAERVFASAFNLASSGKTVLDDSRADYGSSLRDGAAMLALAAETKPAPSLIPAMIRLVSAEREDKRYIDGHTSTQENAWLLLAARAIKAGTEAISIDVNGSPHSGPFAEHVDGAELQDQPVTITNRGHNPIDAVVTAVAAPADPLPAGGDGFSIARTYYTLDGQETDVTEAEQNQRYVVVLKVTEENSWPSRVLVTDLLPAGFEIDNPSLVGSAQLSNFDWLGSTEVAHTEFRDDRFVAAFNRSGSDAHEMTLAYVVRAVTPGVYTLPAASVEDMYRPQLSARTATGRMEVKAAR